MAEPAQVAEASPPAAAASARVVRVPPRAVPVAMTSIDEVADDLASRLDEFPLQTLLVTAASEGKSEATLALARAAQANELRVLLIDADEGSATLTAAHGSGSIIGTVLIQGRARPLVALPGAGRHRIALIPVESRLHAVPTQVALSLKGIAGNFDVVIIDGPALGGTLLERKLARAAQTVLLIHDGDTPPRLEPILRDLGVSAEQLRVVRRPAAAVPEAKPAASGSPVRLKSIVRLRKVA